MPRPYAFFLLVLLSAPAGAARAAENVETPPADKEPVLRVDPGGPGAFVASLAFSPDGGTLYAGGWDKVIRVWTRDDKGVFQLSRSIYRIPVGPGDQGAINALALSPDGEWLAAAGNGATRQTAGFRQLGFIVPSFGVRDPLMLRDVGTIYLFNTRDQSVRMLRGHRGHVAALTFGPRHGKSIPPLLSLAVEEQEGNAVEKRLTARLWDVDKGEAVAVLPGLPSEMLGNRLPGMALWQQQEGGALQAALALYDGNLRLWSPGRAQAPLRQVEDLHLNLSVAHLVGGSLLTGGYDRASKQWQLARWSVPVEGQPKRERRLILGDGFVRALGRFSQKSEYAAVLVLVPGGKGTLHQYRLQIVDLAGEGLRIVKNVLLWRDANIYQSPLATSLRGDSLAVAGNSDHSIHVYSVRALLGDDKPAPQILRGDAVTFRHASFARRGKDLGLLLNREIRKEIGKETPPPDAKKGDWIFDFAKRRLSDDLADWQAARPIASPWRAKLSADQRTIEVFEGAKRITTIVIPKRENSADAASQVDRVTDYALLPPGESAKVPLLALATHRDGQPRLALYNAKSGEELREFTGHTERVHSLAFAPDGWLLVSAANDGTVCLWSLTDLQTILGQHGRLPGVLVGPADKGAKAIKVLKVEEARPVHGKLEAGDVIVGLVEKKNLHKIDSPRLFHETIYQLRPGVEVGLRRAAPKGGDDVLFRVAQGIDERKPLFSLFVMGGVKASECEWIGWSPVGPYEASSPKAEKYLGWHFNTGDPKAPTRFADAGQYRKYYYRENLLDQLIQRGALGRLEAPQLPSPIVGLWVEDEGRLLPNPGRQASIVNRPRVHLKVALLEPPPSSLSALTWRLDGGAEVPLALDDRDEASFRIPVTLSRGEHRFVVTARTREASSQPARTSLILRYQPLRPEVIHKNAGQQLFVRQADFTLEAAIKAKVARENIVVAIHHRHEGGQEKPYTQTLPGRDSDDDQAIPFKQRLKLRPGNNEVEVIAVPSGVPAEERERETGRLILSVFYHFKAKPPTIAFRQVIPIFGTKKEEPLTVDSSQPILVQVPDVNLIGRIKAVDEPLTEALWDTGKSTTATRLNRFEPGKHIEFSFEQRLSLKPGKQIVRLRARTKHGEEVERRLTLEYRPPLPVVSAITAPRDGMVFEGDEETKEVAVQGSIQFPPKAMPYKAVLTVNGKPASQLDEKAGTLTGTVVIGPGENRIGVEMSNDWGASRSSEAVVVRYVRPPVFVGKLEPEPVPGTSRLHVKAVVRSPIPLERASVRVEVNGKESVPDDVRLERGEKNLWTVHLRNLPLDAGSREQKIVLRLANREAMCRAPAVLPIRSETVLPAPEVEFLEPRQSQAVSNSHMKIRFRVRSVGKLERVRLLQGRRPPQSIPLSGREHELTETREIELEPGSNWLSIEVIGVGGRLPDSPQLVLNYVPPPLRVELERLTESPDGGASLLPQRRQAETLVFPKASSGQVWLHGRVSWTSKKGMGRDDHLKLRVFVNGFQQLPYEIQREGDAMETPFQVMLLLNRSRGNRINLVASRLVGGSLTEAVADCAAPIPAQRLHVLALSPYSRPEEVKERLLKAIHAPRQEGGRFPAALGEVKVLTGSHVSPSYLRTPLAEIAAKIRRDRQLAANRKGSLRNDVLLIYYEGGERIDAKGHFFETYSSSEESAFDMPCDKLVRYLGDVPGAHVLLLDVDRSRLGGEDSGRDKIERWKDNFAEARANVVVMRCARQSEAGRRAPVRLIPVLQKKIPQAVPLNKLIALIEDELMKSDDHNLLVFTKHLPLELVDLVIGLPP
jgi:WD40 repeat protein